MLPNGRELQHFYPITSLDLPNACNHKPIPQSCCIYHVSGPGVISSPLQHYRPGKSISEAIEQVPPAEIKKRLDLDNRLSNCYMAWTTKHTGCRVTAWSRAPVLSSEAPGNCKASRPPGFFFIKGWNERSHVADPHITSSCWRPALPRSPPAWLFWWVSHESVFH